MASGVPTAQQAPQNGVLAELWQFRELTLSLVGRELKARYRGSVFGFLWSLINPLLLLSVYSLVFGLLLEGGRFLGNETVAYSLYLVVGLFPWIWFQSSLLDGAISLSENGGLLRKAVFPAAVLPTVSAISHLIHYLLALPILFAALAIGRALGQDVLGWTAPLMVFVVLLQLAMCIGAALALSALNVHFKDVRDLLANVLQLLFFLAPIIYSASMFDGGDDWWRLALQWVIRLNPMTPFVVGYHELLLFDRLPSASVWLQMVLYAAVAVALGSWIFRRLEDTLVEAA